MTTVIVSPAQLAKADACPDWHLVCERCGCCDAERADCWRCGGDGYWVDEDGVNGDAEETCEECRGEGMHWVCGGRCDENGKHAPRAERLRRGAEWWPQDGCEAGEASTAEKGTY